MARHNQQLFERIASSPWLILSIACLIGFSMWAPMFCVPPMEHLLREELSLTHTQTSILYASPNLMIIALAIPAGIVADRIGVRKAAGIGIIILAIGAMLRGTADNAVSLLGFTFVYGIGLGWIFPNLPKLVGAWFPREKLTVATAIYSIGMFVGVALPLATTMSVALPMAGDFQGVFLIWGIPAVVAALLWWLFVKNGKRMRAEEKVVSIDKGHLRRVLINRNLLLLTMLFLIHQFFFNAWSGWAPALIIMKGATPEFAGLISSVTLWVGIPVGLIIPRLSGKLGLKRPMLWISSLTMALVSWGALGMNVTASWFVMGIAGAASTARFVTLMTLPMEFVDARDVGAASGVMLSIGYIGGIIGPLIGGYAFDLTGSLDLMLVTLIGISVAAIVISLKLPETGSKAAFGS